MSLDSTTQAPVAPEELVARARGLLPLLRENMARTDELGNPAPENIAALKEAGLLRVTNPVAYGGISTTMRTQLEIISEVGRGCASTGWITANHIGSVPFAFALPEKALKEVFDGHPDAIVLSAGALSGTRAERVDGGVVISGRFPFASGCEISDWAVLAPIPLMEGDRQVGMVDVLAPLVPLRDIVIEQTWQVAGLTGTGTHAMVVDDLFVPDHFILYAEQDPDGRWEKAVSPTELVQGNTHSLASLVGAARGALDVVREQLAKRKPLSYTTYAHAVDSPAIQLWFAQAAHLVDTAVLHMTAIADGFDAHTAAAPHTELPWEERARIRMHQATALQRAKEAMQKLLDIAGTGGFALSNPLQQYWRDLEIGSRHGMLYQPAIVEDYSRALLDAGPTISLYH
ncbi:hypothetical protein ADK65_29655 [Streptomyces sp. NRRL B-1140]|uniref:acyl-CoA dehydrogenase family protein n=1 Tax=Streptomyces sp. NRRL B-1140 TaxID=1415549 RepID=UPI0006B012F2|nr:acyl-CoA dehydrogenase family protein [Streptomyces sp. NRRL B-1140]KOV95520.1 hypothetical protein ADK65_29655 [Streptomyces sp. NRRL B-1140]